MHGVPGLQCPGLEDPEKQEDMANRLPQDSKGGAVVFSASALSFRLTPSCFSLSVLFCASIQQIRTPASARFLKFQQISYWTIKFLLDLNCLSSLHADLILFDCLSFDLVLDK